METPANGVATTLASPYITSTSQTTAVLTSNTGWTNAQYHALLTDPTGLLFEIVLVTALSGSTVTITRNVESYAGIQTARTFGSGSTIQIVHSVGSIQALASQALPVFYVGNPLYTTTGSIGTGNATNDTAALTAASAAMVSAGGGILLWPAGTFNINSWPTWAAGTVSLSYCMRGAGKNLTILKSHASTLATSLTVNAPNDFVTNGPAWSGFSIDGTSATSTAVGLHWSDVSNVAFIDVDISNFALTDNWYWHNIVGWTEDMFFYGCSSSNAANIFHFAIGSGGYSSFDYWVIAGMYTNLLANQNWITEEVSLNTGGTNPLQTLHEGCTVRWVLNLQTATTNTGVMLNFKGWSAWTNTTFDIHAEVDGGGTTAHQSIDFANSNAGFQGLGTFTILGTTRSPTFAGGGYQFEVSGRIVIPGLYTAASGVTSAGSGGGSATYIYNQPTAPTITSGTAWTNGLGWDVMLYIPVTLSASATLKFVQQNFSISAAGATLATQGANAGTFVFTVRVNANERIRLDVSAGSIGTVQAYWA